MKTYTNKSNAARAAKAANGGTLTGLELLGEEGAWYYAPKAGQPDNRPKLPPKTKVAVPVTVSKVPGITTMVFDPAAMSPSIGTSAVTEVPAKKAPAKPVPLARTAAVQKVLNSAKPKTPAKKVATKKAAPARKPSEVYDVKNGPTQGRISGYHIDTDRDEKHGVKRRSAGTIGGRLWAIFDKLAAKAGGPEKVEIALAKESPLVADFNGNKVVIEFYYWRRYNGVRGRGKKQKVAKS